ncbi:hypothetical protein diail_10529 [Diaporthe ilicicola]|nr:hypothetical protein diail_10529 [Diaporthe ilicicola]
MECHRPGILEISVARLQGHFEDGQKVIFFETDSHIPTAARAIAGDNQADYALPLEEEVKKIRKKSTESIRKDEGELENPEELEDPEMRTTRNSPDQERIDAKGHLDSTSGENS